MGLTQSPRARWWREEKGSDENCLDRSKYKATTACLIPRGAQTLLDNYCHQLGMLTFYSQYILSSLLYVRNNITSFTRRQVCHPYNWRCKEDVNIPYCRFCKKEGQFFSLVCQDFQWPTQRNAWSQPDQVQKRSGAITGSWWNFLLPMLVFWDQQGNF